MSGDDDAAAGNVEAVHDDEPAGGSDLVAASKATGFLVSQRQFGDLVAADEGSRLPGAGPVSSVEASMTFSMLLDLALDFLGGELELVVPALA